MTKGTAFCILICAILAAMQFGASNESLSSRKYVEYIIQTAIAVALAAVAWFMYTGDIR